MAIDIQESYRLIEGDKLVRSEFVVTDEKGHETYIVLNFNTDDVRQNFKNELIARHLRVHNMQSWMEIDNMITRIHRAGVVIL
jgi:hypothetical protein